jgi:hypothetical protein
MKRSQMRQVACCVVSDTVTQYFAFCLVFGDDILDFGLLPNRFEL